MANHCFDALCGPGCSDMHGAANRFCGVGIDLQSDAEHSGDDGPPTPQQELPSEDEAPEVAQPSALER